MRDRTSLGTPTSPVGRGLSRRDLLRRAAWLTAGVPALLLLDAWGQAPAPPAQPTTAARPAEPTAAPKPAAQAATATPIPSKPAAPAAAATTALAAQPTIAPTAQAAQKPAGASGGPEQNKTLRVRLFEDLLNMDPALIATGTDLIVGEMIYNRLLRRDINTGKFVPDLAE